MNELQLLRKQEESASRRIHELEQIVGDVTSSIVKRSQAKVELAGLRSHGVHKHAVGLADTGQVAKNKERVEREILRNLERAGREEEIRRLQALLRDEHVIKSAQRRKQLEARLRAAQAAIEALDIEEAKEEKTVANDNGKRTGASTTQGKISVDVFTEVSEKPVADAPFEPEEDEASVDTPVVSNIRGAETKLNGEAIDNETAQSKDMPGLDIAIESGIVAKGTAAAERRIKLNEERALLQAEMARLRQELRDETDSVTRFQKLIDQLRAAEAALKALDVGEAAGKAELEDRGSIDKATNEAQGDQDAKGLDVTVVAKGTAKAERCIQRNNERAKYEAEIKRLQQEIRMLEAEIEKLHIEGREKDALIKRWQEKAATLTQECLSSEVDREERNRKIRKLQDWRKFQDERIISLQSQITPGQYAYLLKGRQTHTAVHNGTALSTACILCNTTLKCAPEANYVLCPDCNVVSPLAGGGNKRNLRQNNMTNGCKRRSVRRVGYVGLGYRRSKT